VLLIVALWPDAGFAEKPVDPDGVAPEFREVTGKPRAERFRRFERVKKPDQAGLSRPDRVGFLDRWMVRSATYDRRRRSLFTEPGSHLTLDAFLRS
jgi:hypothetical protein